MIWYESLTLKNLQGHVDSTLNFHRKINCIVGKTNQGKTTIIRGLSNINYNKPNFHKLINHGASQFEVDLRLSTGVRVQKIRKKNSNEYFVHFEDGSVEKLDKFRNKIPKYLVNILQSPEFKVDNSTDGRLILNISSQLEGPFLLSAPDTVKAKVLTKLTGGHILDVAIKKNSSLLNKQKQRKEEWEETEKELTKQIEELNYVDESLNKINQLSEIINKYKYTKEQLERIQKLYSSIKQNQSVIDEKKSFVTSIQEENLENIILQVSTIEKKSSMTHMINKEYTKYLNITNDLNKFEKLLVKQEDVFDISNLLHNFSNKYRDAQQVSRINNTYITNLSSINNRKIFFENLIEAPEYLDCINIIYNQYNNIEPLIKLYKEYNQLNERIKNGEKYLIKLEPYSGLQALFQLYSEKFNQYSSLQSLSLSISQNSKQTLQIKKYYELLNKIPKFKNYIDKFSDSIKFIGLIESDILQLNKVNNQIKHIEKDIQECNHELSHKNEEWKQFEVCPFCEQLLPH